MTWLHLPPDTLPDLETHACSTSRFARAQVGSIRATSRRMSRVFDRLC